MSRTKQEVRDFLNAQVGQSVNVKAGAYRGQCVSLIKALMEFLGAPNPYIGRGNAKDAGDTYIREGIGVNGGGWLTIVVNRDMGRLYNSATKKYETYGHIWIDLANETNYEQNGASALKTTKGTRPRSQGQQFVNFDKWITPETINPPTAGGNSKMTPNFISRTYYMVAGRSPSQEEINFHMAKSNPESFINGFGDNPLWKDLEGQRNSETDAKNKANDALKVANETIKTLQSQPTTGTSGDFTKIASTGVDIYIKK